MATNMIPPRPLLVAASLALAATTLSGTAWSQSATPAMGTPTLPEGEGRDLVLRTCSTCHQPDVVVHQRLTHDGWADLVDQMASNGATASDEEFAKIIDYLAAAFPAAAQP